MSATVASLGRLRRRPPPQAVEPSLRRSLRTGNRRQNWILYLFVLLVPLQNIHTDYLPNLGGGINFLNVMFMLALAGAVMAASIFFRAETFAEWTFMTAGGLSRQSTTASSIAWCRRATSSTWTVSR